MTDLLSIKQQQYNTAMEKYEKMPVYIRIGQAVSFVNIGCQVVLGVFAFRQSIGLVKQVSIFVVAYILADFVNGLAHMYMDNADDYESPWGPLVAAFHLHHRTPVYKMKPLAVVYWHETGSKVWMACLLPLAVMGVWTGYISGAVLYGFFYFSVLSSLAEISHYLCHIPKVYPVAVFLRKTGLLMSNYYHARHHTKDNINYTFLNAMTDPLVDLIAKKLYTGYRSTTDTHYAFYTGAGTENRV